LQTDELKIEELYKKHPAVRKTIYKQSFLKYFYDKLPSKIWIDGLKIKHRIAVILEDALYDGDFPKMLFQDCYQFVKGNIPTFYQWEIYLWTNRLLAHGIRNAMRYYDMLEYKEEDQPSTEGNIFKVPYYKKP